MKFYTGRIKTYRKICGRQNTRKLWAMRNLQEGDLVFSFFQMMNVRVKDIEYEVICHRSQLYIGALDLIDQLTNVRTYFKDLGFDGDKPLVLPVEDVRKHWTWAYSAAGKEFFRDWKAVRYKWENSIGGLMESGVECFNEDGTLKASVFDPQKMLPY